MLRSFAAGVFTLLALTALIPSSTAQARPYLILVQSPRLTAQVGPIVNRADYVDTLPFDGIAFRIPASSKVMLPSRLDAGDVRRQLAPVRGAFSRATQNWVIVYIRGTDVFDDWSGVIQNWRALARAARDAGLVGIMFDNEAYFEKSMRYSGGGESLRAHQEQARLRGRQVMQAVQEVYPGIQVLVFHGPYLSEPKSPAYVAMGQAGDNNAGVSEGNLSGAFFAGLVQGARNSGAVIDGGEVYQYRSKKDFDRSYQWRKYAIASDEVDSSLIPDSLRPDWSRKVGIAFAVYDKQWKGPRYPMNARVMRSTLENALRATDKYVWFYVEGTDWLVPGAVSSEWMQAVRGAVARVRARRP